MDYSALPEENAVGSSPWASSPQQHPRPEFKSSTSDLPSQPQQSQAQYHYRNGPQGSDHGRDNAPYDPSAPVADSNNTYDQPYRQPQQAQNEGPRQTPAQTQGQPQQRSPIAQRQSQQRQSGPPPQQRQPQQYRLQAKVNGLERSGRKDPILKFDIHTNLPGFRTTQFRDVRRTHGEFQKLADHLISANPEALVPSLPPASTSAGVGTDEDEGRVKANMQRWLSYVCESQILIRDEEMIRFVEGDPGYSPVIKRSQPATGVRRKMIKQFAPPPDDTPELQEARPIVKRFYLGAMDAGQKVDKAVKARRGLSLAESDFGSKMAAMVDTEPHPGLKNAYRKLGKTITLIGDLHAAQGTAQASTLSDTFTYHSADAFIVKETLTNRQILMRELLQAQQTTRSKLSATDRLKSSTSVRRDKVDEAIAALDEARSHEQYLLDKTKRVTANLIHDKRKWFHNTSNDVRAAIREFTLREIETERRALATFEAIRPDIRAIDPSGGLSRLGREAHPPARRSATVSSQGPKGDAWSGVQRRPDASRSISGNFVSSFPGADIEGAGNAKDDAGRARAESGVGSLKSVQEDDYDRVDAKNAASRLAASGMDDPADGREAAREAQRKAHDAARMWQKVQHH